MGFKSNSNLRKTILGTSLQMMQQWTGVNFIFYYSTPFLSATGAIDNVFLISLIFALVNVCSTPISFWTVEWLGRRPLLIWGAFGMLICQFLVAIIGVTVGFNHTYENAAGETIANNIPAVNAQIAFIAIFIFFFASTWARVPGSSSARSSLSRSVLVVSVSPPPPTGSGTRSSLSLLRTWSAQTRAT